MIKSADENPWNQAIPQQLSHVLSSITDIDEMQSFLRDVMTESEIYEISARLEAARRLTEGARYTDVIEATSLSSRTVARVSDWLANGCGGYGIAIRLLQNKSNMNEVKR